MALISIVCPVYRAEAYIRRCVDSIMNQSFDDFELILVDDGSPDGSGTICDEYSAADSRVKVYHKHNGGVSSARRYGVERATGEYLIHADPDDWVEPDMLAELYKRAVESKADMVICDYYEELADGQKYQSQQIDTDNTDTILRALMTDKLHGALWNKLIKRECYLRYNLFFPLELVVWEDLFVCCNLMRFPVNVAYLPKAFYHYDNVVNSLSAVRFPSPKTLSSQIYFIHYFENILNDTKYQIELKHLKLKTKRLAFMVKSLSDREYKELYSEINGELCSCYNPLKVRFYSALALWSGSQRFAHALLRIATIIKTGKK
ncbi:MAG: glycosyltransferase family 2 protein [Marinifilaceae bacterium]|nr:glycosyltransferase family 2 protein [Marinifilaceae bacterium]